MPHFPLNNNASALGVLVCVSNYGSNKNWLCDRQPPYNQLTNANQVQGEQQMNNNSDGINNFIATANNSNVNNSHALPHNRIQADANEPLMRF